MGFWDDIAAKLKADVDDLLSSGGPGTPYSYAEARVTRTPIITQLRKDPESARTIGRYYPPGYADPLQQVKVSEGTWDPTTSPPKTRSENYDALVKMLEDPRYANSGMIHVNVDPSAAQRVKSLDDRRKAVIKHEEAHAVTWPYRDAIAAANPWNKDEFNRVSKGLSSSNTDSVIWNILNSPSSIISAFSKGGLYNAKDPRVVYEEGLSKAATGDEPLGLVGKALPYLPYDAQTKYLKLLPKKGL